MKKILITSYHFPPDNAVGGLRTSRFARHLPAFGWIPYVLTITDRYRTRLDQKRLHDVRGTAIYQTDLLPSVKDAYLMAKTIFRKEGEESADDVLLCPGPHNGRASRETFLQRLKRYFISLIIFLPDEEKSWVIPAALKALSLIKKENIDCILTSGPPHSSHIIGLIAKKCAKVKWIADFRDPWCDGLSCNSPLRRCTLSDAIEHWMEKMVIKRADRVVSTTAALQRCFQEKYPDQPKNKFLYLPNGIDTDAIQHARTAPSRNYPCCTITYAGTLYEGRSPTPVFAAIKELIDQGRIKQDDVRLKLIGNCDLIDERRTTDVIREYGLDSVVEVSKFVPYAEAIQIMRSSHLLLLLVPSHHHLCVPAKMYDYFGTGTRILTITEQGATRELIEETKSGGCFSPFDVKGIGDYIHGFIKNNDQREAKIDPAAYAQFEIKGLTKRLAGELFAMTECPERISP